MTDSKTRDPDALIMRSVYMDAATDARLRQLAHELNVTKSALIRAAVAGKLAEWASMDRDAIRAEVAKHGGGR